MRAVRTGPKFFFFIAVCGCISFAESSQAADKLRDYVSATAYQSMYGNAGMSTINNTDKGQPRPSTDFELAVRTIGIFSFTAVYSQFGEPELGNSEHLQSRITAYGVGIKVDMPGFFLVGGNKQQSERESKLRPFNTFMFGEILKSTVIGIAPPEAVTSATASRFGFGGDVFLFNPILYLSFRVGLFNLIGATYYSYAYGAGLTF